MNGKRPYKLPEPLLCSADKEINMVLVDEYIRKHEERMRDIAILRICIRDFTMSFAYRKKKNGSRITDWQ